MEPELSVATEALSPRVSICMPVYNGSAYIRGAIDSCLSQTLSDFELIIVDDASSDNTVEIVKSYNDKRIRLFVNENRLGQVLNYNKSISYAEAAYIKPLHQDDILVSGCLLQQAKVFDQFRDIALVFNDFYFVNERSEKCFRKRLPFKPGKIEKNNILRKFIWQLDFNFIGQPSVVMFRKEIIQSIGLFNEAIPSANDIEFWARINTKFSCYYLDTFPLVNIIIHDGQRGRAYRESIRLALLDQRRLFKAVLEYKDVPIMMKLFLYMEFVNRTFLLVLGRIVKRVLNIPADSYLIFYFSHGNKCTKG